MALPPSAPGTADLIEDRPGKITIAVAAPQRQLLVVSESYHDGWQARVDSQPARLERVNGDFLGCVVERGKHQVELVFSPALVRTGRIVSLASFVATMILALGAGVVRLQRQQTRCLKTEALTKLVDCCHENPPSRRDRC